MTSRLKNYVDVDDLLAIRLECRHCESALELLFKNSAGSIPLTCPNCKAEWYNQYAGGNIGRAVAEFTERLKFLRAAISSQQASIGFTISFETIPNSENLKAV